MQTTRSPLTKVAGAINAGLAKRAGDTVKQGFSRLPGGITAGVARLVECGFFEHDGSTKAKMADGKLAVGAVYFRAAGSVTEPESVQYNDQIVGVKGLQTSQMIPVYDTRDTDGKVTTAAEHASRIADELGKLAGLDTFPERIDAQWLEAMADALKKAGPYFRFSTSESKPKVDPKTGKPKVNPTTGKEYEPRVWENWNGTKGLEGYIPPTGSNGQGGMKDRTTATMVNGEPTQFNEFQGGGDEPDIDALLLQAPESEEARLQLFEMCKAIGKTQEEFEAADDWDQVGAWLKGSTDIGETAPNNQKPDTPPASTAWSPVKGEVYKYLLIDPKTNKPVQLVDKATKKKSDKPPIEVEVIDVDVAKQLVKAGDLDSGKDKTGAFKKTIIVGWNELIR